MRNVGYMLEYDQRSFMKHGGRYAFIQLQNFFRSFETFMATDYINLSD